MAEDDAKELKALRHRVAALSDAIEEIAMIADGHRKSTLRDEAGNNMALSVILGCAAAAIGRQERLRETGTIFPPIGTIVR